MKLICIEKRYDATNCYFSLKKKKGGGWHLTKRTYLTDTPLVIDNGLDYKDFKTFLGAKIWMNKHI